jgi:hypothetical protein
MLGFALDLVRREYSESSALSLEHAAVMADDDDAVCGGPRSL